MICCSFQAPASNQLYIHGGNIKWPQYWGQQLLGELVHGQELSCAAAWHLKQIPASSCTMSPRSDRKALTNTSTSML